MNLAIIGATGNVGRQIIDLLEKSKIEIEELFLIASEKSAGKKLKFKNKEISVTVLEEYDFSSAEFTIFAAGKTIAKDWIPIASNQTTIIDNSSFFRMDNNVPLIVPEVNPEALKSHKNIISNPNCSTIQLVLVLKPLHELYKIKRVIVSTYQAVSGAGKDSMDELFTQTREYLDNKKIESKNFTKQIAFNLIPHIDSFVEDGYTKEEWKMENETKKILDKEIDLSIIAAFMTLVGYSLNDTIVVFDRIRENIHEYSKEKLDSVVNLSLNETLSRTVITSLTTLIVVVVLLVWGGEVIHNFAFALTIGILVGTYSSIFVASPVMVYLENRHGQKLAEN